MDALRFGNIVRDLQVDEAAFRRNIKCLAPAERTYVIFFTARSGSSWLTSALSATDQLGYPEEYLNPEFVRDVARSQNARDPAGLLQMLMRTRKSPNGVFGIEVRHIDVELLNEDVFFGTFDAKTIFFNLWRGNIIAQGISLFRAVATQRYHSNSNGGTEVPPAYDAEAIARWIHHVASTENANIRMLERHGCPAIMLQYEDIIGDSAAAVALFARALNISLSLPEPGISSPEELTKIGDGWNVEVEQRFRRERVEFIAVIEAQRLLRHAGQSR